MRGHFTTAVISLHLLCPFPFRNQNDSSLLYSHSLPPLILHTVPYDHCRPLQWSFPLSLRVPPVLIMVPKECQSGCHPFTGPPETVPHPDRVPREPGATINFVQRFSDEPPGHSPAPPRLNRRRKSLPETTICC